MREFPVFVPSGADHLAATITVPEEPRGIVLLVTGTGAQRSHRYQMWTRVARDLSDRGLASVRLDYKGVGDSTGVVVDLPFGHPPIGDALAVLRFAMRATGTSQVAVMGNCSGSLLALRVAAELGECRGAICILMRVLAPSSVNRMIIRRRRSRLAAVVRSNRLLSRLAGPFRGRKGRPDPRVREAFTKALSHSRLLFIFSREDKDAYNEKTVRKLDGMVAGLPSDSRDRFEMSVLPQGPLSGFDSLEVQESVLSATVDWLAGCFPAPDGEGVPGRLSSAARAPGYSPA